MNQLPFISVQPCPPVFEIRQAKLFGHGAQELRALRKESFVAGRLALRPVRARRRQAPRAQEDRDEDPPHGDGHLYRPPVARLVPMDRALLVMWVMATASATIVLLAPFALFVSRGSGASEEPHEDFFYVLRRYVLRRP